MAAGVRTAGSDMAKTSKEGRIAFLVAVGVAGWLLPGGGYFMAGEQRRAIIICLTILATFFIGIYAGSIGVIDPVGARLWYLAQVMTTPAVFLLGEYSKSGAYPVYGRPADIGQIYTSVAGLLNLLVIVNSVYLAHARQVEEES
jgi:hypothetical protein